MKLHLSFFFIILLAINSCKPDKITDVVVEGVLLDASSLEPIEGGTVEINSGKAGLAGTGSAHTKFLEMTTEADGKFYFEFTRDKNLLYMLYAKTLNHYGNRSVGTWPMTYNGESPSTTIYLDVHQTAHVRQDIRLPPKATLRIRFINVDKIYDRFFLNTPPGSPIASGLQLSGMNVDEWHEFTVFGDIENTLNGGVFEPGGNYENGKYKYVSYKIFCKAHDVTELTIEY